MLALFRTLGHCIRLKTMAITCMTYSGHQSTLPYSRLWTALEDWTCGTLTTILRYKFELYYFVWLHVKHMYYSHPISIAGTDSKYTFRINDVTEPFAVDAFRAPDCRGWRWWSRVYLWRWRGERTQTKNVKILRVEYKTVPALTVFIARGNCHEICLGNCPPTPPLSQHLLLKNGEMLA